MNEVPKNVIAYIDGANLHKGIADLGWSLDYRRFRVWLKEKYKVDIAYLFIGLLPANKDLYTRLQEFGYVLVYKEVTFDGTGRAKGNCDADLVLKAARDFYEERLENAVLVSSDGDYAVLVRFLKEKNIPVTVLSPSTAKRCSILLKRTGVKIAYLNDRKKQLERPK